MPHILLTKVNRQGEQPEKVLVNSDKLTYVNPDNHTTKFHWANIETVEGMVCWRVVESSEMIDELIANDGIIFEED